MRELILNPPTDRVCQFLQARSTADTASRHQTGNLAPIEASCLPEIHPDLILSFDTDLASASPKMEDGTQAMPTAAEPEPVSRPNSVSTQAPAPQNPQQSLPGVSALATTDSATVSSQPRSVRAHAYMPVQIREGEATARSEPRLVLWPRLFRTLSLCHGTSSLYGTPH